MANNFKYKVMPYWGIAHPFMSFEHHCFGYIKAGNESTTVHEGYNDIYIDATGHVSGGEEKTSVKHMALFARHEEYPSNILLFLLELAMTLLSWARYLLVPAGLLLGFGIALFGFENGTSLLKGVIEYTILSYFVSLGISILAIIVRKAFKLDEKMDDLCEENGWKKWTDYDDMV